MEPTRSFELGFRSVAAILFSVALFAACSDSGANNAPGTSTPSPRLSSQASLGARHLFYADGKQLLRFDIRRGTAKSVLQLPTPDVSASRATNWIAYVEGVEGGGDDFLESPTLHALDTATGDTIDLGSGFAPLWHPSDDRLAFLRPLGARDCEVETCRGQVTVMVARPGQEAQEVLPPGDWGLLAWAGDRLLVADSGDLSHTVVAGPDGTSSLDVPPSEVWDASPDGRWLVIAGPEGSEFRRLDGGAVTGQPVELDIGDAVLGDGSWAPDSARLAAAIRTGGRSRIAIVGPDGSQAHILPGSGGAVGGVLWSQSGTSLVITRSIAGGRRLQAAICRVGERERCRALLSWVQGVIPLRME